jgi:hypothetical protein
VKLIAEGRSSREIAAELVISEKTVGRHRANVLEKLGMHDRVELTRYAIRRGLRRGISARHEMHALPHCATGWVRHPPRERRAVLTCSAHLPPRFGSDRGPKHP